MTHNEYKLDSKHMQKRSWKCQHSTEGNGGLLFMHTYCFIWGLAYGAHFLCNQIRNWTYFILDYNFINNWWSTVNDALLIFRYSVCEWAWCVLCLCFPCNFSLSFSAEHLNSSNSVMITMVMAHFHSGCVTCNIVRRYYISRTGVRSQI